VIGQPADRGLSFRAFLPNAMTVLALCLGLSGIRFGIDGRWEEALAFIIGAGVVDGMDGRVARLLKAQSKFGAELDSLSDNIAFGTAPALIMFFWSLHAAPRFGWTLALALAVACALRLARYNARIEVAEQPHKSAGFNTGVPAPAGAGLAFVPMYLWIISDRQPVFQDWRLVMPWVLIVAALMISNVPTYSWTSIRIRRSWRILALAGVALLVAALINEPWITLLAVSAAYLATLPFSFVAYRRVRRRRATVAVPGPAGRTDSAG
jgi:CDP-diacylglycerol--serine O-phosphatidyltransferase